MWTTGHSLYYAVLVAIVLHVDMIQVSALASSGGSKNDIPKYHIAWYAPLLSGGGYCSEAFSYISGLSQLPDFSVTARHFADSYRPEFVSGLPRSTIDKLSHLLAGDLTPAMQHGAIICHSEPGAWRPALYQTLPCPPDMSNSPGGVVVGRTMFETDSLPNGWAERINRMDKVWVPTRFNRDIFIRGGVNPDKVRYSLAIFHLVTFLLGPVFSFCLVLYLLINLYLST